MQKAIKLLDNLTINKIAAGEVVEGPQSVVKELIENAIDAGATSIIVEIKEGGQKFIRVTDNGGGIHEEDVETAFMRHATSKIQYLEDLNVTLTLGFRGEALASIAAVSQIQMVTKPKEQLHGISLDIVAGNVTNKKQVGAPDGTTIIVKNLFFNTPARLKFMKTPQSDTTKIGEIMSRLALSQPHIAFKYINNNNVMFTTSGTNRLDQTILSILDKALFKSLIAMRAAKKGIELDGYISQPSYVRGNRNYEIVFVNGRYVKSKFLYRSIEEAYREKLPINKFPVCILNLKIDPSLVDINVHPTKTEIKFHDEEILYEVIYDSITSALSKNTLVPKLSLHSKQSNSSIGATFTNPVYRENKSIYSTHNNNKSNSLQMSFEEKKDYDVTTKTPVTENTITSFPKKPMRLQEENPQLETTQENFLSTLLNNYKVIGQLFDTYVIIEKDLCMYLIDQHAAHERLVYNKMLQEFINDRVTTQSLLAPKLLDLSHEDFLFMTQYIDKFKKLGFNIEIFGNNTILIREVPLIMGVPRDFDFMLKIIDELKNDPTSDTYFNETIIRKSCREAIKAMDKLHISEIHGLIKDLSTIQPPLTCPHGRPILLSLTKYEIEKHFKRIQ
ncbi:DNA mismatch repair endonuclease MutL [Clostridium formicaceticum]|uniref:DNA mismatch repair protein MutL n=1 Tax=Clostridium formicaceticum TaxID=1497 RepID=A0AAC9RLD5_9CLOT|nr:DNA mismatch repair endonuclease MutL [Clostridium formicaceticum]AOY77172.1 DNA mismatch repair protein MutL [Clostridium formicaceticum]ARE87692.1 DNA mismatch repair protein MutL [Clostridium formicaceticum]